MAGPRRSWPSADDATGNGLRTQVAPHATHPERRSKELPATVWVHHCRARATLHLESRADDGNESKEASISVSQDTSRPWASLNLNHPVREPVTHC